MSKQQARNLSLVGKKPELQIHNADFSETARALARVLAREVNNLFLFNSDPVLIVREDEQPVIREFGRTRIIREAHKRVTPWKFNRENERIEVTLPDNVADLVYDFLADEMPVSVLLGFTSAPIAHDDGSIVSDGYDAASKLFVCCDLPKEEV
jgi:hypothetical protein